MELELDKVKFINTNGEISVDVKIEIPKKLYKYSLPTDKIQK